jgi:hypothetical protein
MELRTGTRSAERIVIEDATAILRGSTGWRALHDQLHAIGIHYARIGSGALFQVGDVPVKASVVARDVRFSALQKKLGPFEPHQEAEPRGDYAHQPNGIDRSSEPLTDRQPGWEEYAKARSAHYKSRRLETDEQRMRQQQERNALREKQRIDRESSIPKGVYRAGMTNTLRRLLAFEHANAKLDLRDKLAGERAVLKARYRQFPASFEDWLRTRNGQADADAWRYIDSPEQVQNKITGDEQPQRKPVDLRNFRADVNGWKIHYRPVDGQGSGFLDKGNAILVLSQEDGTILAALQLGQQKWPNGMTIVGDDSFKSHCCRAAALHGFKINNPELRSQIEAERQRIQRARAAEGVALETRQAMLDLLERPREVHYPRETPP